MQQAPRLGIGLPVYNGERYLADVLEDLRSQTYADFEVVVVDNASTDSTPEIVKAVAAVDARFRYVRNETNIGAPGNFNRAFELARGDLYAWVAADDRYDRRYFERCVELIDARPDVVGAFAGVKLIDEEDRLLGPGTEPVKLDHPDVAVRFGEMASFRHSCYTTFAVYRRTAVAATRLLLPFWNSDRVLLAELVLQGPIAVYPAELYHNRQHRGRLTARAANRDTSGFNAEAPRAVMWHYARQLMRAINRADLSLVERRRLQRAFALWAVQNQVKLARSAARAAWVDVDRTLIPRRAHAETTVGGIVSAAWAVLEMPVFF